MNNVFYNIPFKKLCALQSMHHFTGILFPHVDDILQIKSQLMVLDFQENEWTKKWEEKSY